MDTEFWVKAGQLILSLSILIVIHEFGHMLPAKWFNTRVEKFYLFFDPGFSLFKFKKGDTEYGIGWLPLGGYVKISGMVDESMDKEQMAKPPEPYEFRAKPAWQRLIIMLGGVTVNLLFAFAVYILIVHKWGTDTLPPENIGYGMYADSLAQAHGFQTGDIIHKIDGKEVRDVQKINKTFFVNGPELVEIERAGERKEIHLEDGFEYLMLETGHHEPFSLRFPVVIDSLIPGMRAAKHGLLPGDSIVGINEVESSIWPDFSVELKKHSNETIHLAYYRGDSLMHSDIALDSSALLGFSPARPLNYFSLKHEDYSFMQAIPAGLNYGMQTLSDYVNSLKFMATKKGLENVGGFGTFGSLFPSTWDWSRFWHLTAFISIMLAVLNLLPIPALDGGHVMFLLYEMIAGKAPSQKFMEKAQMVGMILLLALILYANGNDIVKFVFK